jgi:hypothetical protein
MAREAHTTLADPRPALRRAADLVRQHPTFSGRYEEARRVIRVFRRPAFYEISQRCNLKCEGCYYFENQSRQPVHEERSLAAWEEFFAAESERGVSMAYFLGAEAALEPERLMAASGYFPHGNIGCNGTIRVDPAIPYRVAVSVWGGDDASDRKLRGASVFRKVFQNYRGDPRALIHYTLSRWNLGGVRTMAEMCRDNGVKLTFNIWSPTRTFLEKLRAHSANDDGFFRVSQPDDTPLLSGAGLEDARRTVSSAMDEFPDTIVYSRAYNDWSTRPEPLHEVDPATGIAMHCGSRVIGPMRYYGPDLKPMHIKCCTPDIDCTDCRIVSGGWSGKLQLTERDVGSASTFSDWLEMVITLGRIFVHNRRERGSELHAHAAAAAE